MLFSSCKKEETTYVAEFTVTRDGATTPFTMRYRLPDGTTQSQGPVTGEYWLSGKIDGYHPGDEISLTLESSGGTFVMSIYLNTSLSKRKTTGNTGGAETLTYTIRD